MMEAIPGQERNGRVARALRLVCSAALACMLSACWLSRTALIDAGSASRISWAGTYVAAGPGGQEEALVITDRGDRSYMIGDGQRQLRGYFLKLGNDWYVAQLELKDPGGKQDQQLFYDVLLHKSAHSVEMYDTTCDTGLQGIPDIEREDKVCELGSTAALKAAADNVVSRIVSGKLQQRPEVFKQA